MKTETKYTEMEQQAIIAIKIHGDEYEDINGEYHPVLTALAISEHTGIPMTKLRGVLSSLDQKSVISEAEFPECMVWMLTL